MPNIDWNHLTPILIMYGASTLAAFGVLWAAIGVYSLVSYVRDPFNRRN